MKVVLVIAFLVANALAEELNSEALLRHYTDDGIPLWEGDMILSQDQVDFLYGPLNTRKAIKDVKKRWTNGVVPFVISQSSAQDRQVILQGLQHWMDNSCLKFVEVQEGAAHPHLIFKKLKGCYSSVGMQKSFGQDVSIGPGCDTMATVAHEVGHAIGFYHEQSRPDRDNYVKLLEANINITMKYNFKLHQDINDYGVPYDLGSLMHYGLSYFTENGKKTMIPLDVHRTFDIGQRKGLSFYDAKLASLMYTCDANCASKPSCGNQGFVDHTCNCRCPKEHSGPLCKTKVNIPEPTCGGHFSSPTTVISPNFPKKYPKKSRCIWSFEAPEGKLVKAHFSHFDIIYKNPDTNACMWDWLEIRVDMLEDGDEYCSKELKGKTITSNENQMAFIFKADYDWNTGFRAEITFV